METRSVVPDCRSVEVLADGHHWNRCSIVPATDSIETNRRSIVSGANSVAVKCNSVAPRLEKMAVNPTMIGEKDWLHYCAVARLRGCAVARLPVRLWVIPNPVIRCECTF